MITTVAQADGHLFGWRARPTGRDTHKYTNTTNAKWLLLFCFCGFKIVWKHNTQHIRRVVLHCGQNMHRHLCCKCGSSHFMVVYILLNLKWIFFWLLSPFRSASSFSVRAIPLHLQVRLQMQRRGEFWNKSMVACILCLNTNYKLGYPKHSSSSTTSCQTLLLQTWVCHLSFCYIMPTSMIMEVTLVAVNSPLN